MMRRVLIAAVVMLAALAGSSSAEAQPTGEWTLEFGEWQTGSSGRQLRVAGGNTGDLEITARGDSLFATYTAGGVALELKGRMVNSTVVLRGTSVGTVNLNGASSEVTLHIEFELTASAGEVKGVHRMGREGLEPAARSFTGRLARQG